MTARSKQQPPDDDADDQSPLVVRESEGEASDSSPRQEDQSVPVDYEGSQEQAAPVMIPGFDPENPTGPRYPGDPNTYPDPEDPPKSGY